ncbi:CoA transferase [Streptomyces sp. NPDC087903]|uniref:CoA transferase n=1 Tax=Streptomyces sp. NPDC087903 TaxID=3365819 RepID=UPI003815950A
MTHGVGAAAETVRRWLGAVGEFASVPSAEGAVGCPVSAWAASGVMELTGDADGPPVLSPASVLPLLHEVGAALASLTASAGRPVHIDPALLLGGRAAVLGLTRRGRTSAGGATRLLPTGDGWCAVTLSRPDDIDLVPAILGRADVGDPWQALAAAAAHDGAEELAARIRLFGVPSAALPSVLPALDAPWRVSSIAAPGAGTRLDGALVVDFSSLWAGPLCAHLLGRAGARVVKVESTRRPDGARSGDRRFFDWLHDGHESVAVDFTSAGGRAALADLVRAADVVIEASRPRAFAELGLSPERLDHRAGKVWISITGYGRRQPDLVALGDDAAVAGGLVGRSEGRPVFCGDAIADPLTGVVAALGAAGSLVAGGGHLVDVAMREVAAAFAGFSAAGHGPHPVRRSAAGWYVECPLLGRRQAVLPPRVPERGGEAVAMGADTTRVLAEVRAAFGL